LRRTAFLPFAILAVVCSGIVGVVLFRVAAEPKPHSVYLKWKPPPPVPGVTVASYNIYRTTQSGGTYDKIASGISVPNYTDRNVSRGKTYYYCVRAVDAAGRESEPSNAVSAAIP
jgi:fibronectin type 3 domain-containing protein